MRLAERIAACRPRQETIALFYLAQAGFFMKYADGRTVCIDPYPGDCCEAMFGFKRMIPAPLAIDEIKPDLLISTHSHADHLDPDLVRRAAQGTTIFVGSPDCLPLYLDCGIPEERIVILAAGESREVRGVMLRAVYADHGESAPDAVGMLVRYDGMTVYDTGDTAVRIPEITASLNGASVDLMLVPINPAFGNPGAEGAVKLAASVRPQVVIGSHFGMFIEHGGDPGEFLACAGRILPQAIKPLILAPAEALYWSSTSVIMETQAQAEGKVKIK